MDFYLSAYETRLDEYAQDDPDYGEIELPAYTDEELLAMACGFSVPIVEDE